MDRSVGDFPFRTGVHTFGIGVTVKPLRRNATDAERAIYAALALLVLSAMFKAALGGAEIPFKMWMAIPGALVAIGTFVMIMAPPPTKPERFEIGRLWRDPNLRDPLRYRNVKAPLDEPTTPAPTTSKTTPPD